jgi:hypothetical protein
MMVRYVGRLCAASEALLNSKKLIDPRGTLLTSWNSSSCYCGWRGVVCGASTDIKGM